MTEVVVIGFTARITGGSSGTGQKTENNRESDLPLSSHNLLFNVVSLDLLYLYLFRAAATSNFSKLHWCNWRCPGENRNLFRKRIISVCVCQPNKRQSSGGSRPLIAVIMFTAPSLRLCLKIGNDLSARILSSRSETEKENKPDKMRENEES